MDTWSPCSVSCGVGSQTRNVRCIKGPEGESREMRSQHCLSSGRRPSSTRLCNQLPCARWATTRWGPVSLVTLTTSMAIYRQFFSVFREATFSVFTLSHCILMYYENSRGTVKMKKLDMNLEIRSHFLF